MTTIAPDLARAPMSALDGTHSFLVTRQGRDGTRGYERLGVLTRLDDAWAFRYFQHVSDDPSAGLLPGLPDAGRVAVSEFLFPVFAERVLSPRRPDRTRILESMGLPIEAGAFEILSRNGGRRSADTIELIQLPVAMEDGVSRLQFLVHGMRHRSPAEQAAIDTLTTGDELLLQADEGNPHDLMAQLVTTGSHTPIGWVPAPLTSLVAGAEGISASVAHVNGSDSTPHLRLLVELRGRLLEAAEFSDPRWQLVS